MTLSYLVYSKEIKAVHNLTLHHLSWLLTP